MTDDHHQRVHAGKGCGIVWGVGGGRGKGTLSRQRGSWEIYTRTCMIIGIQVLIT